MAFGFWGNGGVQITFSIKEHNETFFASAITQSDTIKPIQQPNHFGKVSQNQNLKFNLTKSNRFANINE